jgi:hypothetical protein
MHAHGQQSNVGGSSKGSGGNSFSLLHTHPQPLLQPGQQQQQRKRLKSPTAGGNTGMNAAISLAAVPLEARRPFPK